MLFGPRMDETIDLLMAELEAKGFVHAAWWPDRDPFDAMAVLRIAVSKASGRAAWVRVLAFAFSLPSADQSLHPMDAVNRWYAEKFRKGGKLTVKIAMKLLRRELNRSRPDASHVIALLMIGATLAQDDN